MSSMELRNVIEALTGLSKIATPISLVIARNLAKAQQAGKNFETDYNNAIEPYYVHDEKGEKAIYIADIKTGEIDRDDAGNEIVFDRSLNPVPVEGKTTVFKFENPDEAKKVREKFLSEDIEFDFKTVNPDLLEEAVATGKIPGELLTPLIGNIIPE